MRHTSRVSRGREKPSQGAKCRSSRPRLEVLEDRLAPVVGAYAPDPVPPGFVTVDGVALDGVVRLDMTVPGAPAGLCTGALLRSQRHILTAAHCVTDESGQINVSQVTVTFTFSGWADPVVYTVMPSAITVHPAWNGDAEDGNDIAILTLPALAPSGPAGLGAAGYLPYSRFDEVGKQFEFAGFGQTGTGDSGGNPGTQGAKRYGYNRFDTRTKPIPILGSDTGLAFDYDDGTVFNNTIETIFHINSPKKPVKSGDSMIAPGDSGGPSFLNGFIAGVSSKVYAVNDLDPDGSYGDIGAVERVSLHQDWINGFLNEGHDLVIRMDQQRPEDGVKDTLKLLREGGNVAFYVNDQFYYYEASSRLSSVTIVGSSDSEDFFVDSDLRKIVTFQGGGGTNRVFVRNSSPATTYEVSEGRVSSIIGLRALTLNYDAAQAVEVAGDSADTVKVISVRSGTPVTVVGAGTVNVGGASGGNLSTIRDLVAVNANGTSTSLTIDDSTCTNPRDYDVYGDLVTADLFGAATNIRYQGVTILNVKGAGAGNVFSVFGTSANVTRLYSGARADDTRIFATSPGVLAVDGQAGLDTVTVGLGRNMQHVRGTLRIRNQDGLSTINLENQADDTARTVIMEDASDGNVRITGLAPGVIRVEDRSVRELNLWTGAGNDTFYLLAAPVGSGAALTNVRSGAGDDWINVYGTRGDLKVDAQAGTNLLYVGSWSSGLDQINGLVDLSGSGGVNTLSVYDLASTTSHDYVLGQNLVQRTDKEMIFYQNVSRLDLFAGEAYDQFFVRDTGQPTTIYANGVDAEPTSDYVAVERTTAPLNLDLGGQSFIEVGNNTSSLDNIVGKISVFPWADSRMTLSMRDVATTTARTFEVSGSASGQIYQRTIGGSTEWRTLVEVLGPPLRTSSTRAAAAARRRTSTARPPAPPRRSPATPAPSTFSPSASART